MARKENKWLKSRRVGEVTLFLTTRSPYWQMYWIDGEQTTASGKTRPREFVRSTRETDIGLATIAAGRKNEELYNEKRFPIEQQQSAPVRHEACAMVAAFLNYLEDQGRSHGHIRTLRGQLEYFSEWLVQRDMKYVCDVRPNVLKLFGRHLLDDREVKSSTANAYLDALHNFFGYVIFKAKAMQPPNPAARGRQAELDKFPEQRLRPPTIYPEQINAIIRVATEHGDSQIANLIVFVCEAGFRFREVQFLQVGDIDFSRREIVLDAKRPDPVRVRNELRRTCLNAEGIWSPKTLAGCRPVHITDRMLVAIESMGLGQPDDWVFANSAGNQVAENKTLRKLKAYALDASVLVDTNARSGKPWSTIKWHWLRHFHRTRAHVSGIRRDVSKLAMGHAADPIHDHYRGVDVQAFHAEYGKFDSGIDVSLLVPNHTIPSGTDRGLVVRNT